MNRDRVSPTRRRLAIQGIVLAILAAGALAGCGGAASTGSSSSTPTPAAPATATPAAAKAPCTVAAAMAAVKLVYDQGDTQASVPPGGSDLKCASGIARISVFIGLKNPPTNGPQGSPHLALLEDRGGKWVVANDQLCGGNGQPTRAIPPVLGTVCTI